MADTHNQEAGGAAGGAGQPTEEEMRAAYEAELSRITSSEMILQTAVSLLNIGGRRLGLTGPPDPSAPDPSAAAAAAAAERDLEQVRDAIDAVSGLMPVLERRMPGELGPLRDAISRLQMAYTQELRASPPAAEAPAAKVEDPPANAEASPSNTDPKPGSQPTPASTENASEGAEKAPGPAESSGRLWVPGR